MGLPRRPRFRRRRLTPGRGSEPPAGRSAVACDLSSRVYRRSMRADWSWVPGFFSDVFVLYVLVPAQVILLVGVPLLVYELFGVAWMILAVFAVVLLFVAAYAFWVRVVRR